MIKKSVIEIKSMIEIKKQKSKKKSPLLRVLYTSSFPSIITDLDWRVLSTIYPSDLCKAAGNTCVYL
jgi:hypothetical protein